MKTILGILCLIITLTGTAHAQSADAWIQIEAHPTLREAQARARSYAGSFPQVHGFRVGGGWYAIALGPYTRPQAEDALRTLRRELLIPRDSYVAFSRDYGQRFWPVGQTTEAPQSVPAPASGAEPEATAEAPASAPAPTPIPAEETRAQARASERALDGAQRRRLQEALKWEGFYTSAIDGSFGPGTRNAMGSYQAAKGYEATGILTTRQRAELLAGYDMALATLGMALYEDARAGISLTAPMGMVKFERHESPFVQFAPENDSGVRMLLISQAGDQDTLYGLYDIMETLEIVPLEGERKRGRNSFELSGQNDKLRSYTYAALRDGAIKGFTLVWPPEQDRLMAHARQVMRESFSAQKDVVLEDAVGHSADSQAVDLVSGLQIRRPALTRSGFYVDGTGAVLTTTEALASCERITIAGEYDADIAAQDDALGLALLRPRTGLAPAGHASFRSDAPRLNSEIAVAGYPYGEVLEMPVLTYGTLADLRGLQGEAELQRLSLEAQPGDAGGPVFGPRGAVMGVLLARREGTQKLPANVSHAANASAITGFLSAHGVTLATAQSEGAMAPEDLTLRAADMTVQVSCWN